MTTTPAARVTTSEWATRTPASPASVEVVVTKTTVNPSTNSNAPATIRPRRCRARSTPERPVTYPR